MNGCLETLAVTVAFWVAWRYGWLVLRPDRWGGGGMGRVIGRNTMLEVIPSYCLRFGSVESHEAREGYDDVPRYGDGHADSCFMYCDPGI